MYTNTYVHKYTSINPTIIQAHKNKNLQYIYMSELMGNTEIHKMTSVGVTAV